VNDRRELAEILSWLASAALWGPTPAAEGIRQCKDYLDEIGNHPFGKAVILHYLAGLHAMQDDVAAAHATLNSAKDLLDTLGPTMTGAITQPAALIAMLAGDPATAERHLRLEYDTLYQMGERRYLATTAAKLAGAIAAQGQSRYDEATRLIAISQEAAAGEDLSTQAVSQGLSPTVATIAKRRKSRARRQNSPRRATCSASTPTPCSISLTSSRRPVESPKRTPRPPGPMTSTNAKATCQEPGNRSGILPTTHPPERIPPMVNPHVPKVHLKGDGSVDLIVEVAGIDPGDWAEISGYIIQDNTIQESGVFAPFSAIQLVPAPPQVGGTPSVTVNVPAVKLNPAADVKVITRVAEVQIWPTRLGGVKTELTGGITATWEAKDYPASSLGIEDWDRG